MNYLSFDVDTKTAQRVQRFFAEDVKRFQQKLSELEIEIGPDAQPERGDCYHQRVLQAFQESQDACRRFEQEHQSNPELIRQVQAEFRSQTDRWFSRSWIAERARTKPSGFAGDFEMLVKLYDEATPARGIGGYLDLCILELPLARAVRSRLSAARDFLLQEISQRQGPMKILDIACGPCREYRDWPAVPASQEVEVVAMDSDPAALAYVESEVAPNLDANTTLRPVRYNALRTRSAKATTAKFGTFDGIYSVGLCDYLSDEHLVGMLKAWGETLNEDGVLYIAFKDTKQYDQTPYQWHLDWFFFQRTLEDVLSLYQQAGFDTGAMETTRDETEIIINFISRRRQLGEDQVRFDEAEGVAPAASRRVHSDQSASLEE